ncbi:uncharacterized protein LOC142975237 [Anticarsia gemmatalis]|uniref:uncharacterized protein LOC142975237 n=1 Tax=Anticarsia gemmatalis TaxID=129554 RepID=UPI003F75B8BE
MKSCGFFIVISLIGMNVQGKTATERNVCASIKKVKNLDIPRYYSGLREEAGVSSKVKITGQLFKKLEQTKQKYGKEQKIVNNRDGYTLRNNVLGSPKNSLLGRTFRPNYITEDCKCLNRHANVSSACLDVVVDLQASIV